MCVSLGCGIVGNFDYVLYVSAFPEEFSKVYFTIKYFNKVMHIIFSEKKSLEIKLGMFSNKKCCLVQQDVCAGQPFSTNYKLRK